MVRKIWVKILNWVEYIGYPTFIHIGGIHLRYAQLKETG